MAKVTAQAIADQCGVSRGTVDRVVNGRPGVAPEVRARVEAAIARSGYRTPTAKRAAGGRVTIGFLLAHWDLRYYVTEMHRGIKRAQRSIFRDDFEIVVEEMHGRTPREYFECIERLLARGARGLVLNAGDVPVIRDEIDRLTARGIAVVTYDSDVTGSRRICHICQDYGRTGRMAGGLMLRLVPPASDVLIVTGNVEYTTHRGRVDGFCRRLEEAGADAPRTRVIECLERYDLTYDGVLRAARENPKLCGVYMATESVDACVAALSKAKLPHRIAVVCNDLTPWSREFLLDGRVDFVIDQEFAKLAERAVLVLYELFCRGKAPASEVEYVRTRIVSREMVERPLTVAGKVNGGRLSGTIPSFGTGPAKK